MIKGQENTAFPGTLLLSVLLLYMSAVHCALVMKRVYRQLSMFKVLLTPLHASCMKLWFLRRMTQGPASLAMLLISFLLLYMSLLQCCCMLANSGAWSWWVEGT